MRELILKMTISVDGFVSDPEGENRWMFGADQEAKAWGVDFIGTAGLHIMGSRSFTGMAAYWQTSDDQFAPPMNRIPKAVFSKKGPAILAGLGTPANGELQPGAESWAQATVSSGDLVEEIARLKAQEGKPIMAHGGVSFARNLVAHGLVDQFALIVAPVALGKGLGLFSDLAEPLRLTLVRSRAFPGGAVAQIYRPA
ncbi:dihydrofolate reductase family protein [Pararhizobium sp.]|uniref:dihydrofolate reductase family protein n=1 Tax=Pararhizobium sp. TaxID=1977563 RepID=UPI00271E6493|nr:dihydrofolate reductase family protein [Pararhizobium sp.]MDO9418999.1 dihydrofolate reductase family protein [Pararhizobium sp.]